MSARYIQFVLIKFLHESNHHARGLKLDCFFQKVKFILRQTNWMVIYNVNYNKQLHVSVNLTKSNRYMR